MSTEYALPLSASFTNHCGLARNKDSKITKKKKKNQAVFPSKYQHVCLDTAKPLSFLSSSDTNVSQISLHILFSHTQAHTCCNAKEKCCHEDMIHKLSDFKKSAGKALPYHLLYIKNIYETKAAVY